MDNDQNNNQMFNDDELKKMAPTLSHIKNENPFAVPQGYFDSLNSEVMNRIESLPDFESVSKENPFNVPAGYFDSLPTIIQQRIIDNKSKRIAVGEWIAQTIFRPVPKYSLAFASVALLFLFSTKYFTRTISVDYAAPQLSETEQLDIEYLSQLDESTLADALAEETSSATEVQDQSIENYLLDNDIDLSSITEHL